MISDRRRLLPVLAALTIATGLAACGDDDDDDADSTAPDAAVTVDDAWVRQPATGQPNAALYGIVTNGTDDEVVLVGASTDDVAVEAIEVHETVTDDEGVMSMQEREGGFAIAAGEVLTLEPGGPHVMMLGVDPAEFVGPIEVTLDFDGTDPVVVTAELRQIGDDAMDTDEMDTDEMDTDEMDTDEMDTDEMDTSEMDTDDSG